MVRVTTGLQLSKVENHCVDGRKPLRYRLRTIISYSYRYGRKDASYRYDRKDASLFKNISSFFSS